MSWGGYGGDMPEEQTLRDTGRLAFTRLQRKFYYKPGDVEKLMVYVGIRRKEKEVRERRKNGNL